MDFGPLAAHQAPGVASQASGWRPPDVVTTQKIINMYNNVYIYLYFGHIEDTQTEPP